MTIVAGIDFGTASVRVSVYEVGYGLRGLSTSPIVTRRLRRDPLLATQRHADHLKALESAFAGALAASRVPGHAIAALGVSTTGSTVVALDERAQPIAPYALWCDHRAWREAEAFTGSALPALAWCGGRYSSEWGWAKVLYALRHDRRVRRCAATFAEHCDVIVGTLTGVTQVGTLRRSACAAGHKWLWHQGWPADETLAQIDPLLSGRAQAMAGPVLASDQIAGGLCAEWAKRLGLREGLPVPVGALDAHWDAVGAGCRVGDAVHVLGTSGCLMAVADHAGPMPGIPGVVFGSIDPARWGIESGLAAVGSLFEAIARRARRPLQALTETTKGHRPGQTGLLRMPWDHGDRGPHADATLRGVCLGWQLNHTAADELFAAMEGTAMHTRLLLERMSRQGVQTRRMVHGGGIPRRNPVLNQVFANVLNMPIRVPREDITGRGSAIFAACAAGAYRSLAEAQADMAPHCDEIEPQADARAPCDELYARFARLYEALAPLARSAPLENPA